MKKKILIISNFTRLPWENSNSRFIYLIDLIDKNKFDVELIASNFFHSEKRKRKDLSNQIKDYKITLIDEPGYKKNVCLKRFYSHYKFAKNVEKYLKTIQKPDFIYAAVPSLDVADVASKFAKENNIEFAIDIQDLWPEAFKMVFNIPVISNLIFYPMKVKADNIYKNADYIFAVSETYAQRALKVNSKYKEKKVVYLGTDLKYFDKCKEFSKEIKNKDNFEITYLGTLGNSYDIKNVIDAIKILNDKGINNILFNLFGNGPLEDEFKDYAKEKNVKSNFTGRLDYEKMIGKLCNSDIAINALKKGAAQSIINKVGDYAAAGLPVINTLENDEYKKLVEEYNIGFNVEPGNPIKLAEKIEVLYNDKALREKMGSNNRRLAEERFDRSNSYKNIIKIIEK